METIFFHFFRQQSTSASWNSLFFNWNIFFSQIFILACGKRVFCVLEVVLFCSKFFFCLWKLILKLLGRQFLTTNHIPASGNQFFRFFLTFFQVEAAFPSSEKVFFSKILHSGYWWKRIFLELIIVSPMKQSIKNPFPLAGKTASAVRNWKNWRKLV